MGGGWHFHPVVTIRLDATQYSSSIKLAAT
jgi:hypothetical protein